LVNPSAILTSRWHFDFYVVKIGMPQKGLEKRGGVPSSPFRLRRDKLRRGKRTYPKKGFFLSSSDNLYWEQSFQKKAPACTKWEKMKKKFKS